MPQDEDARIEKDRLHEIISCMSYPRRKALEPIIENVAWMKIKLDDAREKIITASVVIPYDNGGGQRGIRENPMFKGYEALWKSYILGMDKILSALPPEAAKIEAEEIADKPQTILELVRSRHTG